ncbi:MAG: aldose 1-epimerase family protein [Actinomycetota bacterium]|nr:aldose 1-epimerase family protein [Actinomycetota bacterium]
MIPPSGDQHAIEGGRYRAVVTECGATLRSLSCEGRELIQGHGEHEMCSGARGQLLVPWPNRVRDGAWSFQGRALQLGLSEPARHNASHGLVRWASWSPVGESASAVTLGYRLLAQSGYPWTLDLAAGFALGDDGLTVTMGALNRSGSPAPYACGAHPYLTSGSDHVDDDELTLPGAARLLTDDERKLPIGRDPVEGTPYDFRSGRRIGDTVLDHAFTGLSRGDDGRVRVSLRSPSGAGVELWADERFGWLQAYTGDDQPAPRTALAVEPTTAPPDAFNSGEDLVVLAPGQVFEATWGIRALD